MGNDVVAAEVADQEFERFVEAMDLDLDESEMNEADLSSFLDNKRKLTRAMRRGLLTVDEKGQLVYTPQLGNQEPLTFHEPTGASVIAMDNKKAGRDVAKMYATMADMTHTNEARFSRMEWRDLKVCVAITTLFLA